LKELEDKKVFGEKKHNYYISAGIEYNLKQEADKATCTRSNGTACTPTAVFVQAVEVAPLNLFVNFHLILDEKLDFYAGLSYSSLRFELDYVSTFGANTSTEHLETSGAIGFQFGLDYKINDDIAAGLFYRPIKNDLTGTYRDTLSNTATYKGEVDFSQIMLKVVYLL
jgi:outer membrane protein W